MPGKPDQHDEDGEGGDGKRETGTHRRTTLEQRGFRDHQVQSVKVLLQRRTPDMRIRFGLSHGIRLLGEFHLRTGNLGAGTDRNLFRMCWNVRRSCAPDGPAKCTDPCPLRSHPPPPFVVGKHCHRVFLAHRTLLLPSKQRISHQSEPQNASSVATPEKSNDRRLTQHPTAGLMPGGCCYSACRSQRRCRRTRVLP